MPCPSVEVSLLKPFVLVTHSRSGSNLLVRSLNAHPEILCVGELMKLERSALEESIKRLCASSAEAQRLRTLHAIDTGACARLIYQMAERSGLHAAGFKLFYYHAREESRDSVWNVVQGAGEVQIIHLYRPNLFDAFLSRLLASESNVWLSTDTTNSDYHVKVKVDFKDFLRYSREIGGSCTRLQETLSQQWTTTVTYNQLSDSFANTMYSLQGFLGVAPMEMEPTLARQRQRSKWEYVENAGEIKNFLVDAGPAHYV
jgi:LPS sulfotransferase NodH